jgi:hypothetical protein
MTIPTAVSQALPNFWAALTQTGGKPWYTSKTLWAAALVVGAGFYPPTAAIAIAYPQLAGLLVGGIFGLLRFISHGKITAS